MIDKIKGILNNAYNLTPEEISLEDEIWQISNIKDIHGKLRVMNRRSPSRTRGFTYLLASSSHQATNPVNVAVSASLNKPTAALEGLSNTNVAYK